MSASPEYTTGVVEETYEFIWELRNFPYYQQNEYLLSSQKKEFQFGNRSTVWSKWIGGLRGRPPTENPSDLELYLKLLEQRSSSESLLVNCTVENRSMDGGWSSNAKMKTSIHVSKNEEVTLLLPMLVKINPTRWKGSCDSDGTYYFKIKLSVMAPKPPHDNGGQLASSTTSQKDAFAELFNTAYLSDLTVVCSDGKELKAHRAILFARNLVFKKKFETQMSAQRTGVIRLDDLSEPTVKILLHYFYTGDLLPAWHDAENIVEFVYAAGEYEIKDVLTLLDDVLGSDEIPANSEQLLDLASDFSLENAKVRIAEQMKKIGE